MNRREMDRRLGRHVAGRLLDAIRLVRAAVVGAEQDYTGMRVGEQDPDAASLVRGGHCDSGCWCRRSSE